MNSEKEEQRNGSIQVTVTFEKEAISTVAKFR